MEKKTLITAMKSSISEIMETMFFTPVEFPVTVPEGLPDLKEPDKIISGMLNFHGPFSGYFILSVPKKLGSLFTSDFLGEDEENISGEQLSETIKEILNMLAGSTFTNYDDNAVFNLDIPKIVDCNKAKTNIASPEEKLVVIAQTPDNCLSFTMFETPS